MSTHLSRYLFKKTFFVPAGLLVAASSVIAEQASPSQGGIRLEEVMVTAQKREQSVLEVGINISVVDEYEIRKLRIDDVKDIVLFTPNATVKEFYPGIMPIITIRGVGLNDFNAANNPATGVYIDDVSLSSLALLSSDFFDLERMEVLKGPQGTLYGRNSTAGALNITTAKPSFDGYHGRLIGTYGDYDLGELEGMVNAPLSDDVAFRLAVKGIYQGEGYFEDVRTGDNIGDREVLMGRAQVLWSLSEATELLLKAEGQRARSELGSPQFFGVVPTADATNCPGQPGCANFFGYSDTTDDPFKGEWSVDPNYELNQQIYSMRLVSDLGFAELTSVTGYIDFDRSYPSDVDASPFRITDFRNSDDVTQFSQELRLAGDNDRLVWQLGLFYARDTIETTYDGALQDFFNTSIDSSADVEATTMAIFANGEWALADTLTLITGARYTYEEKSNDGFTADLVSEPPVSGLTGAPFGSPPVVLAEIDDTIDDNSVDWRLALNWQLLEDSLVYASISQGTKSGGFFTGVATASAQLQPYDKEELTAYELGVKGQTSEAQFRYEASVFYYDYKDVQSYIRDTTGELPIQRLGNIDGADIYGVDLLLSWRANAIPGLSITVGGGYLDTKVDSFAGPSGTVPSGNELPDAPKWSSLVDVRYGFDMGSDMSAEFAIDTQYQDSVFRDVLNDPLLKSKSYWLLNARAALFLSENWEFSVWGKNLEDEEYTTQEFNQVNLGNGYRVYGAPRTYGVSVTLHLD